MSLSGSSHYTSTDKTHKNKYTQKKQSKKYTTCNTKHSKYKYAYYHNTHTYTHPHITKQVKTSTVQVKIQYKIYPNESHNTIKYPQYKVILAINLKPILSEGQAVVALETSLGNFKKNNVPSDIGGALDRKKAIHVCFET